jgi:hypothetical protein
MPSESNFSIEFPANRDYIPFVQEFLKGYLLSYNFNKEFSEGAAKQSVSWLDSVMPEEKYLHALPIVVFGCKNSESLVSVKIHTSDGKKFETSLSTQKSEEGA